MKANIHPKMHVVKVHCSCGNEFETMATVPELRLDICGACHPFYTGKKRALQAAGRVQRFEDKYSNLTPAPPKPKKVAKVEPKKPLKKEFKAAPEGKKSAQPPADGPKKEAKAPADAPKKEAKAK